MADDQPSPPGFFCVPRGLLDSPVFGTVGRHPFDRRAAFLWLVERACFKPRTVRIGQRSIDIERGQLRTSLQDMGGAWGWDTMKVARFISVINAEKLIEIQTDKQGSTITICDFDSFSPPPQSSETPKRISPRHAEILTEMGIEEREEGNKEESSAPYVALVPSGPSVADQMVEIWVEVCGHIYKPMRLTKPRETALLARWKSDFGRSLERWRSFCEKIAQSPFLSGQVGSFRADLDWVLKPANTLKILEGKYDAEERNRQGGFGFGPAGRRPAGDSFVAAISRRVAQGGLDR
jgi:hypothetical protein